MIKLLKNKIIQNVFWLVIDKLYLLVGGLLVSALVARFLGPNQLGLLSYGLTLATFCITISQWGAGYFIYNQAALEKKIAEKYIQQSKMFRILVYFLVSLFICIYIYNTNTHYDFIIISLVIFVSIFSGLDIYQYYFNAILNSKINANVSMVVRTITMLIRFLLVYFGSKLYIFIFPILLEGFISYKWKSYAFKKNLDNFNVINVKESNCKDYIKTGFPFLISTLMSLIYVKINDITLKHVFDFSTLGIYTTGYVLANAWTFFPLSVGISLLSRAIRTGTVSGIAFVYFSMISISFPILITLYFISDKIVLLIYGVAYAKVISILFVLSFTALLSSLNIINNRYISSLPNGSKYIMRKQIVMTILSIPLTYIFITSYGLDGAVYAAITVELLGLTIANYFYRGVCIHRTHLDILNIKKMINETKLVIA